MKTNWLFLLVALFPAALSAELQADSVLVEKSKERMYLLNDGAVIKTYRVKFGGNPKGHKQKEGDERTPEGQYVLDSRKSDSAFYKAIHISYPNASDKTSAAARGEDPGGAIMIHGQRNGFGWLSLVVQRFNWTDGCIAVTNTEMDEIWDLVPENTPIEIRK